MGRHEKCLWGYVGAYIQVMHDMIPTSTSSLVLGKVDQSLGIVHDIDVKCMVGPGVISRMTYTSLLHAYGMWPEPDRVIFIICRGIG